MKNKLINGKQISDKILDDLKKEVSTLKEKYRKVPHLVVIRVGEDPASIVYVRIKEKQSREIGMNFTLYKFPQDAKESKIIRLIKKLNKNSRINGIIVQLPLPKHLNERKILDTIIPEKDVDGLTTNNIGSLFSGNPYFIPCTPAGIIELIKSKKEKLAGLRAVVVGRSNIVGKPVSILLLKENCTVTICHSKTTDLAKEISNADILVAAIGKPNFIKGNWIKKEAIVIDVGINRVEDKKEAKGYRLVGDVDFKTAVKKASYITPVPGGVGPMTVTMLLKNTIQAFKISIKN